MNINKIKTKTQLIEYISNLMDYNKTNEINVFNDSYMVEPLKNILYVNGFEIRNSYYKTLNEAFEEIVYFLKSNNVNELNNFYDNNQIEADIYTADLLTWLNESLVYSSYCDEVIKEYNPKTLIEILQYAQIDFKREVYDMAFKVVDYIVKNSKLKGSA
jgi:hypothetical protein